MQALTQRQVRLEALRADLVCLQAPRPMIDRRDLERRLRAKLVDWWDLLTRNLASGRDVLRVLLAEPLRFIPVDEGLRRGYRFEGANALDRMVSGIVPIPISVASPTGTARELDTEIELSWEVAA